MDKPGKHLRRQRRLLGPNLLRFVSPLRWRYAERKCPPLNLHAARIRAQDPRPIDDAWPRCAL